jgi:hypothetical protein
VVADAGALFGGQQVAARRGEEGAGLVAVGGGQVEDVDDGIDSLEACVEALAGDQVDPEGSGEDHGLLPGRLQRRGGVPPDESGAPGDRDALRAAGHQPSMPTRRF